jgi:hypothetical protein
MLGCCSKQFKESVGTYMFIVLLLVPSLSTFGQTLIVKAGLTASSNSLNSFSIHLGGSSTKRQISFLTGFTAGTACQVAVSPGEKSTLSLQPEIIFVQKGYKAESIVTVSNSQEKHSTIGIETFQLNYVELPLLVNWEVAIDNVSMHFLLGPSFASALGGTYKSESASDANGIIVSGVSSGKIKFGGEPSSNAADYYFDSRMDTGFNFGCGITLFKKVITDIRYYMGINDLQDDQSSRNKVFQFTLGLPLQLNK